MEAGELSPAPQRDWERSTPTSLAARGLNLVLVAETTRASPGPGRSAHLPIWDQDQMPRTGSFGGRMRPSRSLSIVWIWISACWSTTQPIRQSDPFWTQSMDAHIRELHTNIHSPLKLVYLLSQRFLERGRGGILLMSSLSAYQGSPYISTYAATKAFNIVLAEGLWDEWRTRGVDVLVCVSGAVKRQILLPASPERRVASEI